MGQPKYFQLYLDSEKHFKKLSTNQKGQLIELLFEFARTLKERTDISDLQLDMIYGVLTDQIKRDMENYESKCKKNAENGKKGGRPKAETEKEPEKEPEPEPEPPEKPKKEKPTRHKYGEYSNVLLSDTDMQKLQAEFPNDWQQKIERLSSYMASTGRTYKDHLATIRNWARNDAEREQKRQEQEPPPYYCGEAPEGFYDCDM